MKRLTLAFSILILSSCTSAASNDDDGIKLKALIVDGQNNHRVWPKSTAMMKRYLEESQRFKVDVYRTNPTWRGERHPDYYAMYTPDGTVSTEDPAPDENFAPDFEDYDVVISNFGGRAADWPQATRTAFESYMKTGGGFVAVHSANNSFPDWLEYNKMIALGGWEERNEKHGPYVFFDDDGKQVRDTSKGPGGAHGKQHEFQITLREVHPITHGMPGAWMHTKDECYEKLRGPAEHLTVLATAYCSVEEGGAGRHEPVLMTILYGDGRVFHTTLGHEDYSFESVGFISTFLRGAEWAATGEVTLPIPENFPTADQSSANPF
jgi:type 1 glutamine amidotransferase